MTKSIGTPLYMAPELFFDNLHPQYVASVDVYAFSMIAYEIVTGCVPFFQNGKKLSISNIIQSATEKMQDLISKCWSNDPKERPSFAEIFDLLSSNLTYFSEDVDKDEVSRYIEILNKTKVEN